MKRIAISLFNRSWRLIRMCHYKLKRGTEKTEGQKCSVISYLTVIAFRSVWVANQPSHFHWDWVLCFMHFVNICRLYWIVCLWKAAQKTDQCRAVSALCYPNWEIILLPHNSMEKDQSKGKSKICSHSNHWGQYGIKALPWVNTDRMHGNNDAS